MFYNNAKKDALRRLRTLETRFNKLGEEAEDTSISLYEIRKSAVAAIERIEKYINVLANTPKEFNKDVSDTVISISEFREAILIEKDNSSNNIKGGVTAILGTATGGAIAVLGPTAAMAYATTFGVASTGTAISTLSGAAATNAALAWIGGGALSAGGGGMAAGNAILALAGPIGWGVAGAIALGGGAFAAWKNKKAAEQANTFAYETQRRINELLARITQLENLIDKTNKLKQALDISAFVNLYPNDYKHFNVSQKESLAALINNTVAMGKLINERIS